MEPRQPRIDELLVGPPARPVAAGRFAHRNPRLWVRARLSAKLLAVMLALFTGLTLGPGLLSSGPTTPDTRPPSPATATSGGQLSANAPAKRPAGSIGNAYVVGPTRLLRLPPICAPSLARGRCGLRPNETTSQVGEPARD